MHEGSVPNSDGRQPPTTEGSSWQRAPSFTEFPRAGPRVAVTLPRLTLFLAFFSFSKYFTRYQFAVLLGLIYFYRILPGFAGFSWVFLGFPGFSWVLPCFTGF